jgi:hypothetical protein
MRLRLNWVSEPSWKTRLLGLAGLAISAYAVGFVAARPQQTYDAGREITQLPSARVYASKNEAHDLRSVLSHGRRTVVVLTTLGCSRCLAETEVWKSAAAALGAELRVVVHAADWAAIDDYERLSALSLGSELYACDDILVRRLKSVRTPLIMLATPEGEVNFRAEGPEATTELEAEVGRVQ